MIHLQQTKSTTIPERPYSRSHKRTHSGPSFETIEVPWRQVAHAFTWVAEEQFIKGNRRPMKTEEWVREQRHIFNPEDNYHNISQARSTPYRTEEWEDIRCFYGVEADLWMRQEEQARRLAEEREKTRTRIQDELRRIEARLQQKRETEKREREAARRREYSERQEKERRDRAKLEKLILDAWANYEARWTSMVSSSGPLEFKRIPWPLIIAPRNTNDITRDALVALIFSPLHSQNQSRKDRIRNAQLRWHPDRFRRFIGRVPQKDRAAVEEGVGIVARCLNELMEKENKFL